MNRILLLGALFAASGLCEAADAPGQLLARKGALLFSDDFERAEVGARWDTSQRAFSIVGGALKAGQVHSEHGAVAGVSVPFKDAVIEFRFRFEGATSINAVCDDHAWTNFHAGHICRVAITPKVIRLGDDREGGMLDLLCRRSPGGKLLAIE